MEITQSSPIELKTELEKEKLLVMSNFSFSHSVFKRLLLKTHKNSGLFGKGLRPVQIDIKFCRKIWRTRQHTLLRMFDEYGARSLFGNSYANKMLNDVAL